MMIAIKRIYVLNLKNKTNKYFLLAVTIIVFHHLVL